MRAAILAGIGTALAFAALVKWSAIGAVLLMPVAVLIWIFAFTTQLYQPLFAYASQPRIRIGRVLLVAGFVYIVLIAPAFALVAIYKSKPIYLAASYAMVAGAGVVMLFNAVDAMMPTLRFVWRFLRVRHEAAIGEHGAVQGTVQSVDDNKLTVRAERVIVIDAPIAFATPNAHGPIVKGDHVLAIGTFGLDDNQRTLRSPFVFAAKTSARETIVRHLVVWVMTGLILAALSVTAAIWGVRLL